MWLVLTWMFRLYCLAFTALEVAMLFGWLERKIADKLSFLLSFFLLAKHYRLTFVSFFLQCIISRVGTYIGILYITFSVEIILICRKFEKDIERSGIFFHRAFSGINTLCHCSVFVRTLIPYCYLKSQHYSDFINAFFHPMQNYHCVETWYYSQQ